MTARAQADLRLGRRVACAHRISVPLVGHGSAYSSTTAKSDLSARMRCALKAHPLAASQATGRGRGVTHTSSEGCILLISAMVE